MKPDEIALEAALRLHHSSGGESFADAVAKSIGINEKRAMYILEKWTRQRKWEYGVTLRSGWFRDGLGAYKRVESASKKEDAP